MKAYLAISKTNRTSLGREMDCLKDVTKVLGIELLVFVDQYKFQKNQEREMMAKAFDEIKTADLVIAEVSKKAIGVGVEIGYAYSLKKTIIYLKQYDTAFSTTIAGCATYYLNYQNIEHLELEIRKILNLIINKLSLN